jgi:flagellar hook-basal body complex protein FliE
MNNTIATGVPGLPTLPTGSSLMRGDQQDIHQVMIAVEKADVAFQLMMQVRNKIVNAYQDVSKLQF